MLELLAQSGDSAGQGGNLLFTLAPLLLIGAVFYFMLIRPQQRRAREQQALLSSVEVGDDVVTTAGIFGTVIDIDEEDGVITVEIAPGTQIRMMKAGIARKLVDETYDEDDEAYDDGDPEPSQGSAAEQDGDAGATR
jgi:preprotein translocase subunit YajC